MPRITYNEMKQVFSDLLVANNFTNNNAMTCAEVFATNSLEGVYSHGVNRFLKFVDDVQHQYINPAAKPVLKHVAGALEQWDGQLGPGMLNAILATNRATTLANENGIGCIAMANTNHWMRGGYYAWLAAKQNCIFIAWTNTIANMPAWGATDTRLGNNPFVMSIPFNDSAIVLDMAMSQYAHGKLQVYANKNQMLEVPGGYDSQGNLSVDPKEILASDRKLPAGYWKGAGMSLLLDILAMVLSGGKSVAQISESKIEYAISQVFIAIDLTKLENYPSINNAILEVIKDYLASTSEKENNPVQYPGENVLRTKKENLQNGIPVDDVVWNSILTLHKKITNP
ncbi:MAG: 3-dehydro-L-gulonate 2-dehydrogenase [Bacteroidota bacterium]